MAGVTTVPNVEILQVGEEWHLSTGPRTFTKDDLAAAVGAMSDPAVRAPVVKLGHRSTLNDGEPALGRLQNLRLEDDGMTLVADLVGVPEWLADCMATYYPRRSMEGWFNATLETGRTHQFVVTALALLGTAYPAITTLDDLRVVMTADTIEEIESNLEMVAAALVDQSPEAGEKKGPEMPLFGKKEKVAATVAVEDVRRSYWESLKGDDDWYLWIREMQIDPQQLIVTDDRDDTNYRVTYAINGDEITFSDPVQVEIVYQDKGKVAASKGGEKLTWASRKESLLASADDESRAENEQTAKLSANDPKQFQGERSMTPEQLKTIGLEPSATEEEINAKLAALASSAEGDGGEEEEPLPTPPGSAPVTVPQQKDAPKEGEGTVPAPGTETAPATEASKVDIPEGTVLIDKARLEALELAATRANDLHEKDRTREGDEFIAAAMGDGKFAPAQAPVYRKMYDKDPALAREVVASMPASKIPLEARGIGHDEVKEDELSYSTQGLSRSEIASIEAARKGQ